LQLLSITTRSKNHGSLSNLVLIMSDLYAMINLLNTNKGNKNVN
jgi:hypothetical protein